MRLAYFGDLVIQDHAYELTAFTDVVLRVLHLTLLPEIMIH